MRDHSSEEQAVEDQELDPHRTALVAYEFWRARGCPDGSPEEDWFLAEEHFRHQPNGSMQEAA